MKVVITVALAWGVVAVSPISAPAATEEAPMAQAGSTPAADFGSPPSGAIPLLYNDRHVYATPDTLKQGRVLAALARGGTIYVPLRSMFEQMGASVSFDSAGRTATISKPGAEVVVTVGKPAVIVNGESRPLDVPPIVYHGVVLVPIRVISEGMGAYVQWVPDRRLVVVRYVPAPPPPTEAPPPPRPVPEATLAPPKPTPNPLRLGGFFRSYYFTRQNATNNPGTQFDFSPGAKYVSNGVNQASWNSAIALHGDYDFPNSGWGVGGTYLYANPMDGPCVVAQNHLKNAPAPSPNCVQQVPPNTNPDDTLPGFTLSTFYEAYVKYSGHGWNGTFGNQLFNTPWARPADVRLKPAAFEGGDLSYTWPNGLSIEGADMLAFEPRTSSAFSRQTLLTGYPAGNSGLPSNINVPGGQGIDTNGLGYGRVGYAGHDLSVNGYFYGVSDIVNIWWFDGQYTLNSSRWAPFIALQGGTEANAGASVIGKIQSESIGAQLGANLTRNVQLTVGYDSIPWRSDSVFLPSGVSCSNTNHQITAKGTTFAYFLPLNVGQCETSPNGRTQIYYGGWASPYTDNYANDAFFTTSPTQGMADRRAPGTSWKVGMQYTSTDRKWIFIASDAWYNYGNALAPQYTNLWVLDGQYHFSQAKKGPYRGLLLRYRYIERAQSNTYCGAAGTNCPPGTPNGSSYLGGLPIFKYNRAMLEYDF